MARSWDRCLGIVVLVVAVTVMGTGTVATAEESDAAGVTRVQLQVDHEGHDGEILGEKTRKKIAEKVVERLRTRLEAARFKHIVVGVTDGELIQVEVGPDTSREALLGCLVPSGDFELRPVLEAGDAWQTYAPKAPSGAELRQPSGSVEPDEAFVWSKERSKIATVVEEADVESGTVHPYPESGGWRTLTLGEPALGEASVGDVEIRVGTVGEPFVSVSLAKGAHDRIASHGLGRGDRWAVLLDGEVVAVVDRAPRKTGNLNVSAPSHLAGEAAKMQWARQVAARLAAPIPPKIMPRESSD